MRSLVVYAASGCNLRCRHCAVGPDQAKPRQQLDQDLLCKIVENAAHSGVRLITLIGGEVFHVFDDLSGLFALGDRLDIRFSVNTNLMYPEKITALSKFRSLANIAFSLDGVESLTHDKVRGPGNFLKVLSNYNAVKKVFSGTSTTFDINFVINGLNYRDAYRIIDIGNELSINKINVAIPELKGFASRNEDLLFKDGRPMIVAGLASLLIYWKATGRTKLETNIPPLLAAYYRKKYGLENLVETIEGCGGTKVYGYVDALGNHLPCPSMSFEQSSSGLQNAIPNLSSSQQHLEEIWTNPIFTEFENKRKNKKYLEQTWPCNRCKFSDNCYPCTHEAVSGKVEAKNHLCSFVIEAARLDDSTFLDEFLALG